jgi:prephenate dehydrogenase
METVAIVGTGLIGASFGLALRKAGFTGQILGVSSERALADAVEIGAVDRGAKLAEAAGASDLIFLSQTIGRILDTLHHLDAFVKPGALVTDAGSTKCEIVDAAMQHLTRCEFLGGHPMAGKERRGAREATGDLFAGQTWVLTPVESSALETGRAREFREWLGRIGTRVATLDCEAHDGIVAMTSHLPQLASTALAGMLDAKLLEGQASISGSGLRDMTRLAMSSYDLWRDILATNAERVDRALSSYIQELEHIRENLRTRELQDEFTRGSRFAESLRRK